MSKNVSPLVSILTPTWNRAAFLDRVWSGLNSQTYRNIEWILADDGSTDDTAAKMLELREKSSFPVIIISASAHIGKSRMDNEAVAVARGDFILWNDSDDYLLPNAVDRLLGVWCSIPEAERDDFVGVTALCGDERGVISTRLPASGIFDTTWNDLRVRSRVGGDMLYFTCSKFLKMNPFPVVDYLVSEGVVWTSIGNLKTRICPEILKVVQYGAPNCISFSRKMEYCRGKAYALAILNKNLRGFPKKWTDRLWDIITFIRYCLHGEIGLVEGIQLWGKNTPASLIVLLIPFASLLAVKDVLQGKVKKTHREFERARKSVVITVEIASK